MVIGAAFAVQGRMANVGPMTTEDMYISYLPSAHSFEQAVFGLSLVYGMRCGFFGGNVLKLTEDMQILKPTLFPSVPRLYNRIYGKLQDKVKEASGVKGWLINKAIAAKSYYHKNGQGLTHKVYDKLVFSKMKQVLGGNVRMMITGSAPISPDVLDFLKIAFCSDIVEGYGMTETCAGSFVTFPGDPETGHVGGPLQNVKIRLRDIPEMGYMSTNDPPKGEVCFWGPSIMKGYFRNEEKTAEALHNDWLLSGDVGMVLPNGALKIVDRAKNIFKLSQGEYIAPEKLENVYVTSQYIAQNWVYGDSLRDYVIIFVVLDPEAAKKYSEANGVSVEAMPTDAKFIEAVYDDMMKCAKEGKLNSLEKPKQMMLLNDPWTIENEYLTPTMKMKRNIAKIKLAEEIKTMYEQPVTLKEKK